MTRQLFPSPSQGALICAGGGEEGRPAARASVGAGRRDQLLTPRAWTRPSRFPPQPLHPPGGPAPAGGAVPAEGTEPASRPANRTGGRAGAALQPGRACVRVALRARRRASDGALRSGRVGAWAGVSGAELVCSLFLSSCPHQRDLAVLKLPGRGRGGPNPQGPVATLSATALLTWAGKLLLATSGRGRRAPAGSERWLSWVTP